MAGVERHALSGRSASEASQHQARQRRIFRPRVERDIQAAVHRKSFYPQCRHAQRSLAKNKNDAVAGVVFLEALLTTV